MNNITNNIYSMYWDVGAHTGFCKTITPTISEAIHKGMYSCQFFMGNPKSLERQTISKNDLVTTKLLLDRYPMNIFTHFPYTANLNGSKASLAWNGDSCQDTKTTSMLKYLEYELDIVSNFTQGRSGVVIHPGCYQDRSVGLDTIAKSINKLTFNPNGKLLLENCAGEGSKLCRDFSEIAQVMNGLDHTKKDNVGVCVDTSHITGQGDYDLRSINEVDRMFHDFEHYLGLDKFTLLHLNDSEVPLGSKKDRHACLGEGYIWGEDTTSLIYLLNRCKENNIPMILETSNYVKDMITLAQIQPN